MLSRLRKGLVYPVSTDITEHDLNTDIESWNYDDREVFKGNVDPEYLDKGVNVYWLYDDDNVRVGLAEHEQSDENQFAILWYRSNPFATFFQDDGWISSDEQLWARMPQEAYEDCLRVGIQTPRDLLKKYPAMKTRLVTLRDVLEAPDYICGTCLSPTCKKNVTKHETDQTLFVDDDFVIYLPPQPSPKTEDAEQQEVALVLEERTGSVPSGGSPTP